MAKVKLDKEEQELLDAYENDEWVSVKNKRTVSKYRAIAQATLKKDKRVNIRISKRDLELLQERARFVKEFRTKLSCPVSFTSM